MTTQYTERFSFAGLPLDETLIDLGVRFVLNCPPEDISTAVRLFFQLEEAHWFYVDFAREDNDSLPMYKMKAFVAQLYRAMPIMYEVCANPDAALTEFQAYKYSIPVRGGILVNETLDKVLMVQSWKGGSWGFPKGKINKEEDDAVCAVREVLEETGYDMSALVNRKEYIDVFVGGKNIRMYVACGVPESTHFETQTRKEISSIKWVPLNRLPVFNRKARPDFNCYLVTPFLGQLKHLLNKKKGYATELSTSETGALKNILGISAESGATLQNDEETAKNLLAMLHGTQRPAESATAALSGEVATGPVSDAAGFSDVAGISDGAGISAGAAIGDAVRISDGAGISTTPGISSSASSGANFSDTQRKQDRDIVLNLLRNNTPEHTSSQQAGGQRRANVEGTKEILALLQSEMDSERAKGTPPVPEPHELDYSEIEAADDSAQSATSPVLARTGLLDLIGQALKGNPARKQGVSNPNEHRSTAPSKNSLLSLLNKPKQAESAKLMALLKPAKAPQPAPKRSILMSLLESQGSPAPNAASTDPSGSQRPGAKTQSPEVPSEVVGGRGSQSEHASGSESPLRETLLGSSNEHSSTTNSHHEPAAPAPRTEPAPAPARQSSLLSLLNPPTASEAPQNTHSADPAKSASTASPASAALTTDNDSAAQAAETQPLSAMSSGATRHADAEYVNQGERRSKARRSETSHETSSRSAGNALLGLLNSPQTPTDPSEISAIAQERNAGGKVTRRPRETARNFKPTLETPPVPGKGKRTLQIPAEPGAVTKLRETDHTTHLSAARTVNLRASNDQTPDSEASCSRSSQRSRADNPLLDLLKQVPPPGPAQESPAPEPPAEPIAPAHTRPNLESEALMSLLVQGSKNPYPAPENNCRASLGGTAHSRVAGDAHEPADGSAAEKLTQSPVTCDEKGVPRSPSGANDRPQHLHLLKLLR